MASPYSNIGNIINFAISWNSLVLINTLYGKNIISYTQSAYNLSLYFLKDNKQSVSETTRETSFKFTAFRVYYNTLFKNKCPLSDEWLTWFIGFAEGDGAIQTYDEGKRVRFVLTQKEKDILHKIQFKFNIGVVKHFPQGKSGKNNDFYRWMVDNPSHILLLALLFNGNLVLPTRKKMFKTFLENFNLKVNNGKIKNIESINYIPSEILPSLTDSWLSGFTDAEGCFTVSFLSNSNAFRLRYIISQKGDENLPILSHFILLFFDSRK